MKDESPLGFQFRYAVPPWTRMRDRAMAGEMGKDKGNTVFDREIVFKK